MASPQRSSAHQSLAIVLFIYLALAGHKQTALCTADEFDELPHGAQKHHHIEAHWADAHDGIYQSALFSLWSTFLKTVIPVL